MEENKDWAAQMAKEMIDILDKSGNLEHYAIMVNRTNAVDTIIEALDVKVPIRNYNITNEESVGSFFFDHIAYFERDLTIPYGERQIASHYYQLLGVASQGRINEIEGKLNFLKENKKELTPHLETILPILYSLAKMAKEILSKKRSDWKGSESVGEYEDRKCSESQLFMNDFYRLKELYIKDFHFSRYK